MNRIAAYLASDRGLHVHCDRLRAWSVDYPGKPPGAAEVQVRW